LSVSPSSDVSSRVAVESTMTSRKTMKLTGGS
jgi:hypothetical protein